MGIKHELASAYNSESNGLAKVCVKAVKTMMQKTGAQKGKELELCLRDLNYMK